MPAGLWRLGGRVCRGLMARPAAEGGADFLISNLGPIPFNELIDVPSTRNPNRTSVVIIICAIYTSSSDAKWHLQPLPKK